jgi:hypothetical protein
MSQSGDNKTMGRIVALPPQFKPILAGTAKRCSTVRN